MASVEGEAIGASPKRRQAEPGISAMLVGAADDEVTTTDGHSQATRGLARIEQRLQDGDDGG